MRRSAAAEPPKSASPVYEDDFTGTEHTRNSLRSVTLSNATSPPRSRASYTRNADSGVRSPSNNVRSRLESERLANQKEAEKPVSVSQPMRAGRSQREELSTRAGENSKRSVVGSGPGATRSGTQPATHR